MTEAKQAVPISVSSSTATIKKNLWMIRHAESTHNAKPENEPDDKYFNCGLTEKGKGQAHCVQGPAELLLVSPLRRTLETYIHSRLKVKKLETLEELREWTGWGPSCMYDLEHKDNRESWEQFQARVSKALHIIKQRPEQNIAILSHGGFLSEVCRQLKLPLYRWENAEVRHYPNVVFPSA